MKLIDSQKTIERGDVIYSKGYIFVVDHIFFQEDYGKEGMEAEFIDIKGKRRFWIQREASGHLVGYQDWKLIKYHNVFSDGNGNFECLRESELNTIITLRTEFENKDVLAYLSNLDFLEKDIDYYDIIDSEKGIVIVEKESRKPFGRLELFYF